MEQIAHFLVSQKREVEAYLCLLFLPCALEGQVVQAGQVAQQGPAHLGGQSMLPKVQLWGLEEQHSSGKGAAFQQESVVTWDPGGRFPPPLTLRSWEAHLSLLPRGSWNGSVRCEGEK